MGTRTSTRPPGPKGRLVVGNTVDYDRDRMGFLRRAHAEYGDVFSFDRRTIVVFDPDLVHDLLTRTNNDFSSESAAVASRFDAERSAEDARLWMTARRAGWRGLNRATAQAHASRLGALFEHTIDATHGLPVDVMTVMKSFSGLATADFCLGPDAVGIPEVVEENTAAIEPLAGSSELFPEWLPSKKIGRFRRARDHTLDTLTERIRHRAAKPRPVEPEDLLDVLLAGPGLTELQVQRLIRGILLAAYGVPAAAMTWTVWALATRRDLWDRVSAEASAWHGPDVPPLSALPQTEAVIKEVLRLWPPTWLMGRTALRPTTLGRWPLQPQHQVMFSPYLVHRDPRWWPDPDELLPERWLDPAMTPRRHSYLPFGAGPRVCIGTQLGMLQLTLATFCLARTYEVSAPAAAEALPRFHNLLVPAGFTASFRRRPAETSVPTPRG